MSAVIGIDPGLTGAIVLVTDAGDCRDLLDMPTKLAETKSRAQTRKVVDAEAVFNHIRRISYGYDTGISLVIERVHAAPGQSASAAFNFGDTFGVLRAAATAAGYEPNFVTPQEWKRFYGLAGPDKDAARGKASELFSGERFARKKDHGRAEAALIAWYWLNK
ncbi:MAG: hypothetical protein ACYTFZ_00235 [Planctomycetota bacterium]|jgi:crossover junction endodeoxyribonuclease RuvC